MISRLRKDILLWEGYKPPQAGTQQLIGLGSVEAIFPNGRFYIKLICSNMEYATACGGFVSALLSVVMQNNKVVYGSGLSETL